jgi:hypothetical protein
MMVEGPDRIEAEPFGHIRQRQFVAIGFAVRLAAKAGQLKRHSNFHALSPARYVFDFPLM